MEVPSEVLQKLVCERCDGYLSRGPVHLVDRVKYRCGRCEISEEDKEDGIRMEAYEELAQLMSFPCRYRENGCTSKVPFMQNEAHEEACPFRKYLCPIAESGRCNWAGLQSELLEHCRQDHPNNVVQNACKFTYDITRPSMNNYILFVFEFLFLLQSKVCTVTKKIYHSVRLLDDPARASNFKYTLDMQNKHRIYTVCEEVLPRGLMVLQADTSVPMGINTLLEIMRDIKDTTFTVTIESSSQGIIRSNTLDHNTPPMKILKATVPLETKVRCGKCIFVTLTEPVYRGSWMCTEHAPEQRPCINNTRRCTYSDIDEKCSKHEEYYCQYRTQCRICSKNITGTTLDSHYTQAHVDVTHRAGTVCTVSPDNKWKRLIIDCDLGRVVCAYWLLQNSDFELSVRTPVPSAQLYKYRCTVELSHPDTGHTLTCMPTVEYDCDVDWYVRVPRTGYKTYVHNTKVNIKINITKNDDPRQCSV